MGRLSEYDAFEQDKLRSNPRDERLTTVYIEGRNAARSNKPRTVPEWYIDDMLATINWEAGYDDYLVEAQGDPE